MEPKAGSWAYPGLRLTISHYWALELGGALKLVHSQPSYTSTPTPPTSSPSNVYSRNIGWPLLCITHWARPRKYSTINPMLSLPSRGRQTCEQKMNTQGDIDYERGQPRSHGGPEKGAQGIWEIHFLPLFLSVLWRTLTRYEILDRSHLLSGRVFIFHTAKHLGSVVSPDLVPQYLPLDTYCTPADRHHANLHLTIHVPQEGGGLLRAPSPIRQKCWHWEVDSGTSREVSSLLLVSQSVPDMARPALGTLPTFLLRHGGGFSLWTLCQDLGVQWWAKADVIPNLMEFTV